MTNALGIGTSPLNAELKRQAIFVEVSWNSVASRLFAQCAEMAHE
jgi:hypothetical protein